MADLSGVPCWANVYLVPFSSFPHPPPEGFIALHVSLTATGDDVKRTFQQIKREIAKRSGSRQSRSETFRNRRLVWDSIIRKGETFSQVARKLQKPTSTIKSLYRDARRDILGESSKNRRSRADRRELLIAQVEPADQDHFRQCPQCSKARIPEDLCPPYREYAMQDERSIGEWLSLNEDP